MAGGLAGLGGGGEGDVTVGGLADHLANELT
jgi:hypothetical protein